MVPKTRREAGGLVTLLSLEKVDKVFGGLRAVGVSSFGVMFFDDPAAAFSASRCRQGRSSG